MIDLVEEHDQRLVDVIRTGGTDRVRYAAPHRVPAEILSAAAESGVFIARAPVVAEGRVELLWYLRDQAISSTDGYQGHVGGLPKSPATDSQTPFDNLSWQSFIALNWTASQTSQPASTGLQGNGPTVWQTWSTMADLFGNSPYLANCSSVPSGMRVFAVGSNGYGVPDGHNEEYIQAATGDPAIDVSGNWTLYERRLNDVEIAYLKAPDGNSAYNLTTVSGQMAMANAKVPVSFPSVASGSSTGAIEIKVAWRILNPANHAQNIKRHLVQEAYLTVAPDLVVNGSMSGASICAQVELGMVAMHIIQKNPPTTNALRPQWFWSTFEQVDNAPLAADACDPASPSKCQLLNKVACDPGTLPSPTPDYSYCNANYRSIATNQASTPAASGAQFAWSPTQPYAAGYLGPNNTGTQIPRCWKNYALTDELNKQWQQQLSAIGSVFQNYMLVGTQWGAKIEPLEPPPVLPADAIPVLLSNTVVETYLQTSVSRNAFNNGSCVTCHLQATLVPPLTASADLSFAPGLAQHLVTRRPPIGAPGHDDVKRLD